MTGVPRRKVSLRLAPEAHAQMEALAEELACDVSVAYRATLAVGRMHQDQVRETIRRLLEVLG